MPDASTRLVELRQKGFYFLKCLVNHLNADLTKMQTDRQASFITVGKKACILRWAMVGDRLKTDKHKAWNNKIHCWS